MLARSEKIDAHSHLQPVFWLGNVKCRLLGRSGGWFVGWSGEWLYPRLKPSLFSLRRSSFPLICADDAPWRTLITSLQSHSTAVVFSFCCVSVSSVGFYLQIFFFFFEDLTSFSVWMKHKSTPTHQTVRTYPIVPLMVHYCDLHREHGRPVLAKKGTQSNPGTVDWCWKSKKKNTF